MSNSSNSTASGGIGVTGLLGVAFVILKLTHVINWSWWWVTAPFWGPALLVLAIFAVVFAGIAINHFIRAFRR